MPNVLDRADDARVTAARTDVNNLMQALKLYKLDNQRFPSAEQGTAGPRRQADRRHHPAELEAPSGQAAQRPLGAPVPVCQPGREGEIDAYSLGADGQPGGEGKGARSAPGSEPPGGTPVPLRRPGGSRCPA